MNKHKLRTAALLVAVVLCFFVASPVLIQGTSAFVFGQSHICRAVFYAEKQDSSIPDSSIPESSIPESSAPESSVPESSDEKPPTGDGLNIMPLVAMLLCSVLTVAVVWISVMRSTSHKKKK